MHGYLIDDGERIPDEGKLTYRGIDVQEIVDGCVAENRFGFEEVAWLLLFGKQPTGEQLSSFCEVLNSYRELPEYFAEDIDVYKRQVLRPRRHACPMRCRPRRCSPGRKSAR